MSSEKEKRFTRKVTYKYYRMIPKNWRPYVKHNSARDIFSDKNKQKLPWSGKRIKSPHLFIRQHGWKNWYLSEVPPDPHGGMTECSLEITDNSTSNSITFISRVKCSNKDVFCYRTGRDMALDKALNMYLWWLEKSDGKIEEPHAEIVRTD